MCEENKQLDVNELEDVSGGDASATLLAEAAANFPPPGDDNTAKTDSCPSNGSPIRFPLFK